ncbi:MAG: hypothetical protein WC758_07640 [Candidatus Woesearchaeota archaeon]|jgi:hypothetical protein
MKKSTEILIIISIMILLISIVWIVDTMVKDSNKFLVYDNVCENKKDFIPEDCLVLSKDKLNSNWLDNCKVLLRDGENKLYNCSDDRYIVEIVK